METDNMILIGSGANYWRKEGLFDVYSNFGIKEFPTLTEAILFCNHLEGDVAIWDITEGASLVQFKSTNGK